MEACSSDSGFPSLADFPERKVVKAADKHTIIAATTGESAPELGSTLHLIPDHCDLMLNLHDWIIGVRDNRVDCTGRSTRAARFCDSETPAW